MLDAKQAGALKALRNIHYELVVQEWDTFTDFQKMFIMSSTYSRLRQDLIENKDEIIPLFRSYFEETILKLDVDPKYYDQEEGYVIGQHFDYFL